MLTIRGRLITPFILGSMSVGLNILYSSFVYEFMSLDYSLGTMTATTVNELLVLSGLVFLPSDKYDNI